MLRKLIFTLLLLSLGLAGCSPAANPVNSIATATLPLPSQANIQSPTVVVSSCTVVTGIMPTPDPTEAASLSVFKPVSAADWARGPQDAAVTFIEYSDFQCPYCSEFNTVMDQVLQDFPGDVRVVFRPFPNPGHDKAMLSAQASEAAGSQGKFWEMADLLFNEQQTWYLMSSTEFESWVGQQASSLGLDVEKFQSDLHSDIITAKLNDALAEDMAISIPGTPFILINGKIWQGPRDIGSIETVIKLTLLESKQVTGCPPAVIDVNKQYLAHLVTEKGDIVIQLFPDAAPIAVNSFVFLAKQGWFNGITFHRVIPGSYVQSGDPSGTGYGTPGYAFINEINPDLNFDKAGVVGMANAGTDSNGSQFFITLTPQPDLDGKYTVFGQVVQGMDVLENLTPRDPSQPGPLPQGDKILEVKIEEK